MESKSWTTVDKSTWGDGPWQDEPDKAQWQDELTRLPCLMHRSRSSGGLCGYVGVPPGHPWYGVQHDAVGDDDAHVSVHGGLTFSDFCREGANESEGICHVPGPGEPERVWWLGFDCGHSGDLSPAVNATLRELGHERRCRFGESHQTYRTLEYVKAQCARLAQQVAAKQAKASS